MTKTDIESLINQAETFVNDYKTTGIGPTATLPGELVIAIDFDGTITTNPHIHTDPFELRPECKRVLTRLHEDGMKLILWTCRTDGRLTDALEFLEENDLLSKFDAINDQLPEVNAMWSSPARKVGADIYVDDKNMGIKLDTLWKDLEELVYGGIE